MTTTAAEGLRNCFFLNKNKIQMASSTERFANLSEAKIQKLLEDTERIILTRIMLNCTVLLLKATYSVCIEFGFRTI
jgi:hypothetical protein